MPPALDTRMIVDYYLVMTSTQQAQLTEATTETRNARHAYETATTLKARRAAAEDIEFWSNKSAFLGSVTI